jgi:hypothetical protein
MKKIEKEELFGNLKDFLKSKGVELQDGSYTKRLRQGCGFLTDSINLSQATWGRAKAAVDKHLDSLRQTIHEQTAPRTPPKAAPPKAAPGQTRSAKSSATRRAGKKK